MPCLDENSILSYLAAPPSASRTQIEQHLDQCSACRALVAAAVHADTERGASPSGHATRVDDPTPLTRPAGARPPGVTMASAMAQPPSIEEGAHVGRFRIVRRLGAGGMGEVYVGYDTQLGRQVALKLIRPELVASDDALRRFYTEARATAKFDHPHIVRVYEVGEHAGVPYLALEYLEGVSLREHVGPCKDGQPPVTTPEAIRIALAIARALAEAHQQGVLHRDLKPGNIHVASDGQVRVLDFGLAKLTTDARAPVTLLLSEVDALSGETQGVAGTPRYLAPERWRGVPSSEAADVWALGAVLFELLAGARPFAADCMEELEMRMLDGRPTEALPSSVPAPLREIVDHCLTPDPNARPPADAVAARLAHCQDEPLSPPSAAPSTVRANPHLGPDTTPRVQAPTTATQDGERRRSWAAWTLGALLVVGAPIGGFLLWTEWLAPESTGSAAARSDERAPESSAKRKESADPLQGRYDTALAEVKAGRADEAIRRIDAILDALSDAGVKPGTPRSRFAARTQMLGGDAHALRVVAPVRENGAQVPRGLGSRVHMIAMDARVAYQALYIWKHNDLYLCATVRGAEVQEKAARIVSELPLPPVNAPGDLYEDVKKDNRYAYERLVEGAIQDYELALRTATHDRKCRPDAEKGLARAEKLPSTLQLP